MKLEIKLFCCVGINQELNYLPDKNILVGMLGGMKLRAVSLFKMAHNAKLSPVSAWVIATVGGIRLPHHPRP